MVIALTVVFVVIPLITQEIGSPTESELVEAVVNELLLAVPVTVKAGDCKLIKVGDKFRLVNATVGEAVVVN